MCCHMLVTRLDTGFGLIIEFIGRLQLVTTNACNSLINLYMLRISTATAHIKPSVCSLVIAR
jgi:hypothetical protein